MYVLLFFEKIKNRNKIIPVFFGKIKRKKIEKSVSLYFPDPGIECKAIDRLFGGVV